MNRAKLAGIMAEKGFSQRKLAAKLGLSKTTLNLKLNHKADFKVKEVIEICDILKIDNPVTKARLFLE